MEFNVNFPQAKGLRFSDVAHENGSAIRKLSAKAVSQIGGDIYALVEGKVILTINYVEDYDESSTFAEYEQRAIAHSKKIIKQLQCGVQ
ncbi:hypothetical protein KGP17_11285 [Serratia sp. JSRIV001]|uniref:hypothetical protein n=1 Tax=unclassified Serratia (in: enterobacteria) TaxID=2647522 RepID=UPI001CBB6288|nr:MULTISPECIES: hypothetical protein [unclassified Serratia (in: enterobacteria)]UAN48060.1 hypothetical protein KGP17_11285 [Serratia sp. JSRIV001]UAN53841.1 hypothetical protein KGP26_12640 [Serratia sp. JSRIV002]UAN65166.1 hypothetical protein KGP16_11605 [Serratia sp. JSRIV006]